jgi:hypothetical protein
MLPPRQGIEAGKARTRGTLLRGERAARDVYLLAAQRVAAQSANQAELISSFRLHASPRRAPSAQSLAMPSIARRRVPGSA